MNKEVAKSICSQGGIGNLSCGHSLRGTRVVLTGELIRFWSTLKKVSANVWKLSKVWGGGSQASCLRLLVADVQCKYSMGNRFDDQIKGFVKDLKAIFFEEVKTEFRVPTTGVVGSQLLQSFIAPLSFV